VRSKYPGATIVLEGMHMPASMGPDFEEAFRGIYPGLAAKNGLALVPFLLDGVAGNPDLNQADGIHPNAPGAAIVAERLWKRLRPILLAVR
jgi:acyl-CoA thioesterase I